MKIASSLTIINIDNGKKPFKLRPFIKNLDNTMIGRNLIEPSVILLELCFYCISIYYFLCSSFRYDQNFIFVASPLWLFFVKDTHFNYSITRSVYESLNN